MQTRCALWLNNQGLHDLDDRVIVTDIQELTPRIRTVTAANARGDGLRIIRRTRQSLSVTAVFLLREYDTARRKSLCDAVCAWASQGGFLTLSDRPGQRLQVVCDALPAVASVLRWTDPLSVTFTAYEIPYWQDEHPAAARVSVSAASTVSTMLRPSGSAPRCMMEASISNVGTAPVTALTISAGDTRFHLSDDALIPPGVTLEIAYDSRGLMTISRSGESMLHSRSADSSDDLLLIPGQSNAITIHSDQAVNAVFKARGLYL